jgi:hypothetical protein
VDQGSGLEAIAHDHHPGRHLICLRRFLSSLKKKSFSFEVGNLVNARSLKEFESVKSLYESQIPSIEEPRDKRQYVRLLAKEALGIENSSIVVINLDRWKQVSIWQRTEAWNIPTTTNCEESMNGHMNDNTPRRNLFWRPIFSIIEMILQKTQTFRLHVLRNFNGTIKRAMRRARQVLIDIMTAECRYFQSSQEQCNCAETRLQSRTFRMRIPYIHRFAVRFQAGIATKHVLSETMDLRLKKSIDHLRLMKVVMRRDRPVRYKQHVKGLKAFAQRTIKRFSHTREKEKLQQ